MVKPQLFVFRVFGFWRTLKELERSVLKDIVFIFILEKAIQNL